MIIFDHFVVGLNFEIKLVFESLIKLKVKNIFLVLELYCVGSAFSNLNLCVC